MALALGAIAFAGLGLAAAALIRSAEAVAAVVNVIILPMSFLSGSFGRRTTCPASSQASRTSCRSSYLIELVLATYVDGEPIWEHPAASLCSSPGARRATSSRWRRFGWEPRER